jgi:mxaJ protein
MRTRSAIVLVAVCAAIAMAAACGSQQTSDPSEGGSDASALKPAAAGEPERILRVCADPDNLPFSNQRLEGLENRLATLIAEELEARVEYTWWAQRRGFVRDTIAAGLCDVVMGVPSDFESTYVTRPYYRSSYVFVSRAEDKLRVRTLDDPVLRRLRIGVQLVGEDGENTPPAHALADRGVVGNLVGYGVYGNSVDPNPPARIIEAVASGDVDLAVVWGPLAGYFAPRQSTPLVIRPVTPQTDRTKLPLAFDIGVGVSRARPRLRDEIDLVLTRKQDEIMQLLDEFGVPRVARPATPDRDGR